jgi:hypothetical protein
MNETTGTVLSAILYALACVVAGILIHAKWPWICK